MIKQKENHFLSVSPFSLRYVGPSLIAITAVTLSACGGGSGSGGGGGSSLTSQDQAAVAALGASGFANAGLAASEQGEPDDDSSPQPFQATPRNSQSMPCDSGSQTTTESTGAGPTNLSSPFHSGQFELIEINAQNCVISMSEQGFSFSSSTDGQFTVGTAEGESVMFVEAVNYQQSMSSNFQEFGDIELAMNGILHSCEGCSSPQSGGDFELVAALEQRFSFGGTAPVDLAFGDGFSAPFILSSSGVQGGAGETTLTGRMAVNQSGTNCGFDAVYETVSPIITENAFTENERAIAGELNVTADGTTHRVEFQGNVVLVDGQPFDQSRIEELQNTCSFAFDDA